MPLDVFTGLLTELLANYFEHGWPFLTAHLVLAFFFLWNFWSARSELRELGAWTPAAGVEPRYTPGCIVDQFVADADRHGRQGSLIPMTDYSDRLDAHIDHRVAALTTRANLFLVIGVMGTFFALFQFAFRVRGGLPPDQIGQRLSEGLAVAFPIGFIGLILTLAAHVATDSLEGRFRKAADDAVHKALYWRSEHLVTIESEILQAIDPLRNLQATLSQTLQPVIEGFREQLKQTHAIMAEQIKPLAVVIARLDMTGNVLNASVQTMQASVSEYGQLVERAAEVGKENLALIRKSRKIFEDLDDVVRAASGALADASNRLSTVPQILSDRVGEKLDEITARIESAWQQSSSRLFEDLSQLSAKLDSSSRDLAEAAGRLQQLPEDLNHRLMESLTQQADAMAVSLEQFRTEFKKAIDQLVCDASEAWRTGAGRLTDSLQNAVSEQVDSIRTASSQTSEHLKNASNKLIEIGEYYKSTLESLIPAILSRAVNEIMPYLNRLESAVVEEYPKALANLKSSVEATQQFSQTTEELLDRVKAIQNMLINAAAALEKCVASLKTAAAPQSGEGSSQAEVLTRLVETVEALPANITAAFALGFDDGKPVVSVKSVPFWKKV
ncbi:MAG: hypothetical protein ACUVS7_01660 [Bryobacteraceae bacterium]